MNQEEFAEFMKAEYNNIAQAHFNINTSVAEFFKAYIAIVSLPISLAVVFGKPSDLRSGGMLPFLKDNAIAVVIGLSLVWLIGLLVMSYLTNLRCDALLYARTVNGVRNYFYTRAGLSPARSADIRVLPIDISVPPYFERSYFLFVVLAFAVVGTAYLLTGIYFYGLVQHWIRDSRFWTNISLLGALSVLVHVVLYWSIAQHRHAYLAGRTMDSHQNIIGIDIDGVLNEHRRHFSVILKSQTGKDLDPESITTIPVHKMPSSSITKLDEHAVFNWPRYWTEMPVAQDAARVLMRTNRLGFRVWLFTKRDWPDPKTVPPDRQHEYWEAWYGESWWSRLARISWLRTAERRLLRWGPSEPISSRPIHRVTKRWLQRHSIPYERLVIERSALDQPLARGKIKDRFTFSEQLRPNIFVEDNLENALRLASYCRRVLLIDQPYNRVATSTLPRNVTRIAGWADFYDAISKEP